jgi:hypothetical protein
MALTNNPDDLLGYEELAETLGIGLESARAYNARAVDHRRKAARTGDPSHIRPGDLPEPDAYFGQSPVWRRDTIDRWNAARPGRGNVTAPVPVVRRVLATV